MKDKILSFLNIENNFSKLLIATIVFYFYKTAFWPLTYLFVTFYILLVLFFILKFDFRIGILGFIRGYLPPLLLIIVFILTYLLNGNLSNSMVQKDILLILVLLSLFYFLYWSNIVLKNKISAEFTLTLIIGISFIISVLNLIKTIFPTVFSSFVLTKFNISEGSTLAFDYNFYCLFIIIGLVLLNYKSKNAFFVKRYSRQVTIPITVIYTFNIILSGSRRGIVAFVILAFLLLFNKIVRQKWSFNFKNVARTLFVIFSVFLLLYYSGRFIIQKIPKDKITYTILRYSSIIGISDYNYLNKLLWDPDNEISKLTATYYNRNYSQIDLKYIKSSDIGVKLKRIRTPYGESLRLNKSSSSRDGFNLVYDGPAIIYLANHSYQISFKIKLSNCDLNSANVGWLVDDGKRGYSKAECIEKQIESIGDNWYNFKSRYSFIDNQIGIAFFIETIGDQQDIDISDIAIRDLDFDTAIQKMGTGIDNKKDLLIWINNVNPSVKPDYNLVNNGNFKHNFGFWRYTANALNIAVADTLGLKYSIIKRGNGDGGFWSLIYNGRSIEFKQNNTYQIAFKMKPIFPKTIPFCVGFGVDEGLGYVYSLPLQIDTLEDGWLKIKANYTFKKSQKDIAFPINQQISNSEFYITDISLINLTNPQFHTLPIIKTNDIKEIISEKDTSKEETLLSSRTNRWQFAFELWKSEYHWKNKLFGHGFDFYEWYSKKFKADSKTGDYPHNPFITILLYSGLFGLLLYFWLLYNVFYLYIYYRKKYGVLFICYIITFFFSFFSGSNPFDPPIMGFFMFLPFYIHICEKSILKI